jgi:glycerol-3-phosphate dehydrogenase
MLNRDEVLAQLDAGADWDVIVIGGGATGLGAAVDAAARGYRTLLLEGSDFCKGTSSRSTKLIHGGVRYLRQGNVHLVRESLRERGRLLKNAPDLVHPLPFIIPTSSRWESAYYWTGLKAYNLLAGRFRIKSSRYVPRNEVLRQLPGLSPEGLFGGISYYDAQFDDARLGIALARTLSDLGGMAINYMPVTGLLKQSAPISSRVTGVLARDEESGREFEIPAKAVINATGIFTDSIRRMDDPEVPASLSLSQGIHIVLDRSFFPGETALIIPRTEDGRVLFLIPWENSVLIGTTDTPVNEPSLEPRSRKDELAYLLEYARKTLVRPPERSDIRSTFAGLRPLVKDDPNKPTSRLSRDHVVTTSESGLVTITGGKWTTYRVMAEDAVKAAVEAAGLEKRPSATATLALNCGTDFPTRPRIAERSQDGLENRSHGEIDDDVIRFVREEMARTVEDVLSRRCRLLLHDARAAIDAAPRVAAVMGRELGKPEDWAAEQVEAFRKLASGYLLE